MAITALNKPQSLYYAHSMLDYDSAKERAVLARLRKKYRVINPATDVKPGTGSQVMKPYLYSLGRQDAVVVSDYHGFIGKGVYEEIRQALYLNKPVYYVNPARIKAVVISGVKIYDSFDWKYRFGELIKSDQEVIL